MNEREVIQAATYRISFSFTGGCVGAKLRSQLDKAMPTYCTTLMMVVVAIVVVMIYNRPSLTLLVIFPLGRMGKK